MLTKRARFSSRRPKWPPLILLVPGVCVAAAVLLPLVYLIVRSVEAGPGIWSFILRPRTLEVLWRTLLLATSVTLASLLVALPIAWLTLRTDLPFRRVWFVLCLLPLVIPSYVGSFAMVSAFAQGGLVASWLSSWLNVTLPSVYGFWGALIVLTLFNYPYMLLAIRAGLRGLDPSLEEAARSLGRTSWQTFFQVTLPHLRPAIAAGALLVSLYGVVLLVDALVRGRARLDRVGSGVARRAPRRKLRNWTLPALFFLSLVVVLALVAPLSVIALWLWRGLASSQSVQLDWLAVWNTFSVSALTAAVATLAAVPVAVLAVRFPSRPSALLERLSYVGYALPGIVVALSLVFFGARYAPWLYQSIAMLVFGYTVLFIPQAVGTIRATLLQINPHLEEAARSLGRSPAATLLEVTLPLVRPGLITGAALVFLTTMKELPATLLLGPTGFNTLATRTWSWSVEAFFAQAAPYALLLVLVSSLSVAILLSQEELKDT